MTQGWKRADYFSIFSDNRKRTVRKEVTSSYYERRPLFAHTTKGSPSHAACCGFSSVCLVKSTTPRNKTCVRCYSGTHCAYSGCIGFESQSGSKLYIITRVRVCVACVWVLMVACMRENAALAENTRWPMEQLTFLLLLICKWTKMRII
jgi:hypothetical protein